MLTGLGVGKFITRFHSVRGGPVVGLLEFQRKGRGVEIATWKDVSKFLLHLRPLASSAETGITLTVSCRWDDQTAIWKTGHPS